MEKDQIIVLKDNVDAHYIDRDYLDEQQADPSSMTYEDMLDKFQHDSDNIGTINYYEK